MDWKDKTCQVLLDTDVRLEYDHCGKKAVALIKDIVCSGLRNPFYVCKNHAKHFLRGNHYKLIEEKS